MKTEALLHLTNNEQQLLSMARRLPADQVLQLVEFARFLEFQSTGQNPAAEIVKSRVEPVEEEPWDKLLAQPTAKRRLRELAEEAIIDDLNGRTTEIIVTKEGRLAPA